MTRTQVPTGEASPFNVIDSHSKNAAHVQQNAVQEVNYVEEEDELEEEEDEDAGSDTSAMSEENHRSIPQHVLDDMAKFEASFKDLAKQYRLIDRIGEGSFGHVKPPVIHAYI